MITKNQLSDLNRILASHKTWLNSKGKRGIRASLAGLDLSGIDLSGRDLRKINFSRTNLSTANLSNSNFEDAYFIRTNLSGADLTGANLAGCYLNAANFTRARLTGAKVIYCNITQTNFSGIKFSSADFSNTNVITFSVGKYSALAWKKRGKIMVKIGCKEKTLDWWLKNEVKLVKTRGLNPEIVKRHKIQLIAIKRMGL